MKNILILDPIRKGNKDSVLLADYLANAGFTINRPEDIRQFIKSLDFGQNLPDAVLYLHALDDAFFQELISALDFYGIPIFNPPVSVRNTSDRLWLKLQLKKNLLPTPDFFYGHPMQFKKQWDGKVLKLRDGEDNLVMLVDKRIHTQDRIVFLEELIHLPKGYVDSIFVVGDDVFQTAKNDALGLYPQQNVDGEKELDPALAEMARRIGAITGLAFYSVDFVDGRIIDVNAFPNIFWERSFPAVSAFLKKSLTVAAG